jgi:hypothetical protein
MNPFPNGNSDHYVLPGRTNMDPELILPDLSPPLAVTAGQELQIWFGQDLLDWGERDNTGISCCDVYVYYDRMKTFTISKFTHLPLHL